MKYISRKFNCNNIFKLTDKGFTLVELLVVIIILGVLVTLAIPSITEYILDSRKKSYILTANSYISEVRTSVNSAEIQVYDPNVTYYIPRSCIKLEKGGESPYGKFSELYVAVTYDGNGYDYYFTSRDTTNNGIYLTYQSLLDIDLLKSNVTAVSTSIGIGNREKILVLDDTCDVNNAKESFATSWIPERGKSTGLVGDELELATNSNCFDFSNGTITNYKCDNSHVVIPEYINGERVTSIGSDTFYNNINDSFHIYTITIPSTVVEIEDNAIGCMFLYNIINKTGKDFDWGRVVGLGSSETLFETGKYTDKYNHRAFYVTDTKVDYNLDNMFVSPDYNDLTLIDNKGYTVEFAKSSYDNKWEKVAVDEKIGFGCSSSVRISKDENVLWQSHIHPCAE